jgi:hypothetical protein
MDRAIAIARGCLDYGGGYRSDPDKLDAFHHGIRTVITALEAARDKPDDVQVGVLELIGRLDEDADRMPIRSGPGKLGL